MASKSKVSKRSVVPPFRVMEALRAANEFAKEGHDVIHLSLGQPGEEVPARVRNKLAEMLIRGDNMGYTDAPGTLHLRTRIAEHYKKFYGLDISPNRVVVTVGSSGAFTTAVLAAFDVGDKVAIANPCYPAYPNIMDALGVEPVFMRATAETHYQPTVAMLKALPEKPQGLVIASPSNPAGTIIPLAELKAIAAYCEENGIRLISDEIYHGVTYGEQKIETAAALSEHAVVINSFSKYFLMPGWRLGWAIVPEDLTAAYDRLIQNFFLSPPAIAQYAAAEVFDCMDELNTVVKGYAKNRDIMLSELPKAGIVDLAPADGAFYIYANVRNLTNDSVQFCKDMLHATGVVAVGGYDFDRELGGQFIRFSIAGKEERIREACERLKAWLGDRTKAVS